jgi:glycosyltransferase involved in cell wall biosynthesis
MDRDAVQEFLDFGYVTDERSIYRDVKKLPPATILEWREGQAARDALRENAFRDVLERYTPEAHCVALLRVYQELAGRVTVAAAAS